MREAGLSTGVEGRRESRMPARSIEETAQLGKEIYERDIRHEVEKDHVGKICAIDVDSGCWALGDDRVISDEDVAVGRLREQRPEAIDVWFERVGYRAVRSFGAGSLRRTD